MSNNMALKHYINVGIVLPIFFGLAAGLLVYWGELDDAPGLVLIGIVVCAVLLFIGIRNINKINRNIKPSIVLPVLTI